MSSSTRRWRHLRVEIDGYRELGERVVALGVIRGAGKASHVEVANHFAVVSVVRNSRFVSVDTYNNWQVALEAAGLASSGGNLAAGQVAGAGA